MTIKYAEPAKTDFDKAGRDSVQELLAYLGNHTECHKLLLFDNFDGHIGYYSKRRAVQPAAINHAVSQGFKVACCTSRTEKVGSETKNVGYVEFRLDTDN
jgi:hypothetical protein